VDTLNTTLIIVTLLYAGVAFWFWLGLHRPTPPSEQKPSHFLSVVIAARNEEDFIVNCLDGLIAQTFPTNKFEVIVVDDESCDNTSKIVQEYTKAHPHIMLKHVGSDFPDMSAKKRPLSVGIAHAKGEWIVTTDADCQVPPTWLEHLSKYMDSDTDVLIGFSQLKTPQVKMSWFEKLQAYDFLNLLGAAAGATNWGMPLAATGQNFAYRKSLFHKIGGFLKISHRPSGDDVLLLQLLRKATKQRIVFAASPKTFVSTHRSETPFSFWRQRKRWASNATLQIRLNPIFFAYILIVFATHALIPLSLIFTPATWAIPLLCWVAKSLSDLLVSYKAARLFSRTDLLALWPIWEILQPFYIVAVGVLGSIGGFAWKGRQHH